MNLLTSSLLVGEAKRRYENLKEAPVTVLQIGEGNFLRGFFDWMIHECRKQELFTGSIAVVQPRLSGQKNIQRLAAQDGLYTLVIRGVENGVPMSRNEIISVFSEVFDPYTEWGKFAALAVNPHLSLVVSNTTEAGLAYQPEPLGSGSIQSFPGKITYLLFLRFQAFEGSHDHGLTFLPCELLEHNGDKLRDVVLKYAEDWDLPSDFKLWVREHNKFLNSLVDRIVTGYPSTEEAEDWFRGWGTKDTMLCTAEPYHLWAIETGPELDKLLPFRQAGLNVHFTSDLKPFQERKVRILNGVHTWMAPLGLIHGIEHVRELLEHPMLGQRVREVVMHEILPTLPYSEDEIKAYAANVFERFANPYIRHRLEDIAMNSLSKFCVRLLPTLAYYGKQGKALPEQLVHGLAGLLRYYHVEKTEDGLYTGAKLSGEIYTVRDNIEMLNIIAGIWSSGKTAGESTEQIIYRLLSEELLWGQSLAEWTGLTSAVAACIDRWERGRQQ
ncbi:tagaturonate reductase [Paenibacillus sp. HN-1]|uniref:tagaturonate reductase n=1 Tax=Paenibacillus TaxID=44249 RepID=UPI001CA8C8B2|nr:MULTISPECIES: tagaturonate reductase [Paenibacillus]MBY9078331.1 tagaturonate reductase [Paenibacillus sp. CGMCC 1.18879]MBY9086013.1 tagaturonate reductase [Paenibacillus sinensis]